MRKIILVAVFVAFAWADSLYFMPYQANEALRHLITEIKNAKSEVKIAIYSFTNREIAKAIRDSAKRGVRFSIVFDAKSNLNNQQSTIGYLAKLNNIAVCTLEGRTARSEKYNGIMHNKLALIDNRTIILGSANWSKSAFELNFEALLVSQNSAYIAAANDYFARLFGECKGY